MEKKLMLMLIIMLLLSGCTTVPEETEANIEVAHCTYYSAIGDAYVEDYVAQDNQLLTSHIVITRDYQSEIDEKKSSDTSIKASYDKRKEEYQDIMGLEYNYSYVHTTITETINFDYTLVSFDYLVELGFLSSNDVTVLTLDKTIANLENSGYICTIEKQSP